MRAFPPPVPPPLMPKIGPSAGSRRFTTGLYPSFPRPSVKPMDVVVFPSPAGVGVMPVTTTSLPLGASGLIASRLIFALYRPNGMRCSWSKPSRSATALIGSILPPTIR